MKIKDLADYCLKCKNPACVKGCPLHNDIPSIMQLVSNEQLHDAYRELLKTQIMPELCGKLCAHDHQCEGKCIRGIKGEPVKIGEVESTLAEMFKNNFLTDLPTPTKALEKKNIAIVGGGITGITCAIILAKAGLDVTIYEKESQIGGTVLQYVPRFRQPEDTFYELLNVLKSLNVTIIYNKTLGKNLTLDLLEEYDYQIICTGAQHPTNIWNEEYPSCFYGLDILKDFNKHNCEIKNRNIIVIGAGNVAMDVSRALKRLDNNVTIVYRRNIANSPASKKEIAETIEEGVNIAELWAPIQPIIKNESLIGLQVQKMRLTEAGSDGRRNVVPIEGAISNFPCDTIVIATGAKADRNIFKNAHISQNTNNYLNYYFGGDYYTGPKTIVDAIASGKDISKKIIDRINSLSTIKKIIKNSKKEVFFGGSFNPPTIAHKNILKLLSEDLEANVILVPNGDDYHYHNKELLDFDKRVDMLKLLTKDLKNVRIDKGEQNRPFKGSVETLKAYNHPWFVIGADSLAFISTWIEAKKLVKQNRFIVLNRQGFNVEEIFQNDKLLTTYKDHFIVIDYELGDISSSSFRKTYDDTLLTIEVFNYINQNNLYKEAYNEPK